VPKIIVGFRTNDMQGRLVRVQELETAKIPGLVREDCARNGAAPEWEKDAAINFLGEVLGWLKKTITKDGVWKMRRTERSSAIELWKVEESGYGEVLSREFADWREELAGRKMGDELDAEVGVGGES
jgi:RAT1-interacting protein